MYHPPKRSSSPPPTSAFPSTRGSFPTRRAWRGSNAYRGQGSRSSHWGRGTYFTGNKTSNPAIDRSPSPPVGSLLREINYKDIEGGLQFDTGIKHCEDIASYNWVSEKHPTILVPGEPPAWTPLKEPRQLKEDDGQYFRDQNAARNPSHPMEPAVQAIFTIEPRFPGSSADIFGCGSTLGNLRRFASQIDKPFRMLVEAVGGTVFLIRRENSPTETIPDVRGFGHAFPEAYTSWGPDVRKSESHQRIIQYELGGLKCLIRFEADGYHKDLVPTSESDVPNSKIVESHHLDSVASALGETSFGAALPDHEKPLRIKRGGRSIPKGAIFDLKTRSIKKIEVKTLGEELPRIWLAQISNFVIAHHQFGTFNTIQKKNVHNEVEKWKKENEGEILRFVRLLKTIISFAQEHEGQVFELRRRDVDVLEIREPGGDVKPTLPAELKSRWLGQPSNAPPSEDESYAGIGGGGVDPNDDREGPSSDEELDYTACSAEDCGYCGHCRY